MVRWIGARIVVVALCATLLIAWFGGAMRDTSAIVHEASVSSFSLGGWIPNDRDCEDFEDREAAQAFFETHRSHTDPHELDADNDGNACEDSDY